MFCLLAIPSFHREAISALFAMLDDLVFLGEGDGRVVGAVGGGENGDQTKSVR